MFILDFFGLYMFILFINVILLGIYCPCMFASFMDSSNIGSKIVKYSAISSLLFPIFSTLLSIYFSDMIFLMLNIFPILSMSVGFVLMNFE